MRKCFDNKQVKEKILNRLSVVMTYQNDFRILYGDDYKNTIDKWVSNSDITMLSMEMTTRPSHLKIIGVRDRRRRQLHQSPSGKRY